MSDKQAGQAPQRKPSTNKNIKKLRAISMVCGLTSSWQKWVADNENKQASEPSGWAPSSLGGPTVERLMKWVPKKPPPAQTQPTEASQSQVINSEEAKKILTPHKETQDGPKTEEPKTEEPKTKEPKTEEPKTEEPKTKEPKMEEPKTEEPKTKEPKTEEPRTEEPKTEEPKTKEPKTEEPKTEEPKTKEPKTEEPRTEEPKTEEPKTEEPKTEEPKTEEPKTEEPKTEEPKTSAEPPVESCIKVKQVAKTVTSGVAEKGASVGLRAEKIKRESLPSDEEIDRLLKKKSSPTRRRKCSNMVSSLTRSWKQVEKEQKLGKEARGTGEGRTGGGDKDDSGHPEAKKEGLDTEDAPTQRTGSLKETEEEESDEDSASSVKIKRPTVPIYKKEAEDANKINALSKKYSAVGNLKSRWQNWASEHTVNQKLNPFSEYFDYDYSMSLRLQKGQEGYGRPKEGTQTAERAKRAEQHIHREIADMCYVIRTMADPDPDGKTRVTFGALFDRYVRISDKVVGILMRARKHGKVAFEGEMLWQGQDDGVIITLLV